MQQDRRFSYTLILGVCVLTCLLLAGKIWGMVHTAPKPQEWEHTAIEMKITEKELAVLLQRQLQTPLREFALSIHQDGQIQIAGTVEKQALPSSIAGQVPRSVWMLLPNQLRIQAALMAKSNGQTLQVTPTRLQIDRWQVPVSALPPSVPTEIGSAVERMLKKYGFHSIQLQEGALLLTR